MCCCDNDHEVNKLVNINIEEKEIFFNQQHNTKRKSKQKSWANRRKRFLNSFLSLPCVRANVNSVKRDLIQFLCCTMQLLDCELQSSIVNYVMKHCQYFYDVNDIARMES